MFTKGCFTVLLPSVFKIHFQKTLISDFLMQTVGFLPQIKQSFSSEFSILCSTRFVIILRRKLQNSTYLITKMMFIQLVLSRECGTREKKEKSFLKLFYIGDNSAKIVHHKICPSLNERLN